VGRRYVRPDVLSRRVPWLLLRRIGLLLLASLAFGLLLRWWLLAFKLLLRWTCGLTFGVSGLRDDRF